MAIDPTVAAKVYHRTGSDELVVASGGKISVESGGEYDFINGSKQLNDGTQASTIADPTGGTPDAEARTAINAIIDALQGVGIVA